MRDSCVGEPPMFFVNVDNKGFVFLVSLLESTSTGLFGSVDSTGVTIPV